MSSSKRNISGSASRTRKRPEGTRSGLRGVKKGYLADKAATSPTIDKYLKAKEPPSPSKEREDSLVKTKDDKSTGHDREEERRVVGQPCSQAGSEEKVDSVEVKPQTKVVKADDEKEQAAGGPPLSSTSPTSSKKPFAKVLHKDGGSGNASGRSKGGARRKNKVANPRASSDGDFIPGSSGHKRQHLQQSLRDHFPVRRSTRKPKAILESEKFEEIAEKLLDKDESGLQVVDVEGKGRGVVSTRPFSKGELVCEYSGEQISYEEAKKREDKYGKDESIGCYMYYFEHKGTKLCVDATKDNRRMGRLLNHSKTQANVVTKLYEVKGQPYLCLIAARDIKTGEELQYDYGERSKAAIESHPWLAA